MKKQNERVLNGLATSLAIKTEDDVVLSRLVQRQQRDWCYVRA